MTFATSSRSQIQSSSSIPIIMAQQPTFDEQEDEEQKSSVYSRPSTTKSQFLRQQKPSRHHHHHSSRQRHSSSSWISSFSMLICVRLLLLLLCILPWTCHATISCTTDEECELALRPGSKCHIITTTTTSAPAAEVEEGEYLVDDDANENVTITNSTTNTTESDILGEPVVPTTGICTNPFHYGGCLKSYYPNIKRIRICGSDDPMPDALEHGHCRMTPFVDTYKEIRIASQNWESVFFQSWILQIILSEMLNVPTSIETGTKHTNVDFYNIYNRFEYGVSNDWDQLRSATLHNGDCTKVVVNKLTDDDSDEEYQSCAHIIPEVWEIPTDDAAILQHTEQPPQEIGSVGEQHWYIPKLTAERDLSLLSYIGLQGEKNRQKLAETFKRPTTWYEYCTEVSETNCTVDDGVAKRFPQTDVEMESMFVDGEYIGHFRYTEDNDCTLKNSTCTGHIADWPCGWMSYVKPLTHHLNIPLKSNGKELSGGYTYNQLTQIWQAANATRSDVIMEWWNPQVLYQQFMGTEAEFTKIILPPASQTCIENHITRDDRCSDTLEQQIGSPLGACDHPPLPLRRLVSNGLYDMTYYYDGHGGEGNSNDGDGDDSNEGFGGDGSRGDIPEALVSPSYEMISKFRITHLELNEIMGYWLERNIDQWNYDPRDATCRWVIENLDMIQSTLLPPTYPRVAVDEALREQWKNTSDNESDSYSLPGVYIVAVAIVSISMVVWLSTSATTLLERKKRILQMAQINFLWLVLCGLLLMILGSIVLISETASPSNTTCISSLWLFNLGFTIEQVAILVKISTIHRLVTSGKGMHRLHIKSCYLYGFVILFSTLVCAFLLSWTLLDPPNKETHYELTDELSPTDEIIVVAVSYCGRGEHSFWMLVTLAWQCMLVLSACVLTFVASLVRDAMNDARAVSVLIYCHFFFVAFRVVMYLALDYETESFIHKSDTMGLHSIVYSLESMFALMVYFAPKLFVALKYGKQTYTDPNDEHMPDLFLNTTIMFADISGFTAWSSMREPTQVFKFLETIYSEFDAIAERRKVFKVETVADCYGM